MGDGWIKMKRGIPADLIQDPEGTHLLMIIAQRTNRETGEAYLGNWEALGFKNESRYRRTKQRLTAAGYATFRTTGKVTDSLTGNMTGRGTVAALTNTDLYDVNAKKVTGKTTGNVTGKTTTNKNINNKKDPLLIPPAGVPEDLWLEYLATRKRLKAPNTPLALKTLTNKLARLVSKGYDPAELIANANEGGWKSVYEPKDSSRGNYSQRPSERDLLSSTDWATGADQ